MTTELGVCPWNPSHVLALVGLQTPRGGPLVRQPRHLVLLLDVSASMDAPDRLPLARKAVRAVVPRLAAEDTITIVSFADDPRLVLPTTTTLHRETIDAALEGLRAAGSSNVGAGLDHAYSLARELVGRGVPRVILVSDGDFNVGPQRTRELARQAAGQRGKGVFLTVFRVGHEEQAWREQLLDANMDTLADQGDGNYDYLDSVDEAQRVLVDEADATLVTVAKDVKVQVAFDPRRVSGYRLIGYGHRSLHDMHFANDDIDGGELGAGQSFTALYEIELRGETGTEHPPVPQSGTAPSFDGRDALFSVAVRSKHPAGGRSEPSKIHFSKRRPSGRMPANLGFAAAVAEFGLALADPTSRGGATLGQAAMLARQFPGLHSDRDRSEFAELVDRAKALRDADAATN